MSTTPHHGSPKRNLTYRSRPLRRKYPAPSAQVAWYRKKRAWLITQLGGKCIDCQEDDTDELEFDHTEPRDWEPRKKSRWQRMVLYLRDWRAGIIELRCRVCNARKGHPVRSQKLAVSAITPENEPF